MSGCFFFLKHGVHSTAKPKLTAKRQSGHLWKQSHFKRIITMCKST